MRRTNSLILLTGGILSAFVGTARADLIWDTLTSNPALAVTSQGNAAIPTQAADDFFFTKGFAPAFRLNEVKFNGLLSDPSATVTNINIQLYQTYPFDSDPARTPATVRANGPADHEFATFDSTAGSLRYTSSDLGSFAVARTITAGDSTHEGAYSGGLTGDLRQFDVSLTTPILLSPAANGGPGQLNHYWVAITVNTSAGDYYWLAGTNPPITTGDRQSWLHTDPFDPDWHRVSDIINGNNTNQNGTVTPAFNMGFQLSGQAVPEPSTAVLLGTGLLGLVGYARRSRKAATAVGTRPEGGGR